MNYESGDMVRLKKTLSMVFRKNGIAVVDKVDGLGNFCLRTVIGDFKQEFKFADSAHLIPLGMHLTTK